METNFISAIEIMTSASMDFFSNSTQKLGRLVVQKSEIFLKVFEFDLNSRHNQRLMEI